jgi:hypothetical protein
VTNVTEEGEVLGGGVHNWDRAELNNFRQNVQGEGIFWAPDLTIDGVAGICPPDGNTLVRATVENRGSRMVGPGVTVAVYATPTAGTEALLGTLSTTRQLFPGDVETLEATWDTLDLGLTFSLRVVVDDDGTGAGAHNECVEDNNEQVVEVLCIGGGG